MAYSKGYPLVTDNDFNEKITQKFIKYKIPAKKKSFNEICFPKNYTLQIPQQFVGEYINPKTPYKSLLIYHRIGAGKTMSAIVICEKFKHTKNILIVVPASLIGNFRDELRSRGVGDVYLTDYERKKLKNLHPSDGEFKDIIERSNERIDKYYSIYSYNKFVELYKNKEIKLTNTLLVIDEIQNMVSPTGTYYNTLHEAVTKAPKDLRIVILSATPIFDHVSEIALTMNLLRMPQNLPTGSEFNNMFLEKKRKRDGTIYYKTKNLDLFKEYVKGFISYYRGAPEYTFPKAELKYVKCEMSEFQYRSYVTAVKSDENLENKSSRDKYVKSFYEGNLTDLSTTFYLNTRLISNVAFPNKKIHESGLDSFVGKHLEINNLEKYSIKFFKIFKKMHRADGPVYLYSNFLESGLKSFARVLEYNGYKNYSEHGQGRKRFAFITSEQDKHTKEEIKHVYNQLDNINGSKLKILLLSSAAKEGLSLKAVRQVHILEPYWNQNRLEQIIGRGSRYCSHAMLPADERIIKIYIYLAVHPNEKQTVDQYISKLADRKQKLIKEFENAIHSIAVDCELNKNANGKDIVCDN
jgi:superfamily II DNA or RNA helicase